MLARMPGQLSTYLNNPDLRHKLFVKHCVILCTYYDKRKCLSWLRLWSNRQMSSLVLLLLLPTAMHESSKRLSQTLRDVYELDWLGGEDLSVIMEVGYHCPSHRCYSSF